MTRIGNGSSTPWTKLAERPPGACPVPDAQSLGAEHYGAEREETIEAHAEEIVVEEMKRRRWREEVLGRRVKGHAGKVAMAAGLRAETAVTVKWIAEELQIGAWTHVWNMLSRQRRKPK